jgi:carbamoyl-phosphate synthase/aspartate carbamoyltransferase
MYNATHTNKFKDKILVNACFESKARTSLSFESAMYRLGGNVITFNKDTSNVNKWDSFEDTIKTLSKYGDAMVLRHPDKNMIEKASKYSNIPILNGGNGDDDPATQGLLDLFTIHKQFNLHERLNILFIGDIKHSSEIKSLLDYISLYPKIKVNMLPYLNRGPTMDMLYDIGMTRRQLPDDITIYEDQLDIEKYDVIYVAKLKEEIDNSNDKVSSIIDNKILSREKTDCILMTPSPINKEIGSSIYSHLRSNHFEQIENEIAIRKAILHYSFVDLKEQEKYRNK